MSDWVTTLGARRVEEAVKSSGKLLSPSVPGQSPLYGHLNRALLGLMRTHPDFT